MEFLTTLWLPIVVAAVLVFVVSSVIHMVLPIHKGDYKQLPDEPALLEALRGKGLQPGHYVFPYAACMQDLGSPEMAAKYTQGPVGMMLVARNGQPAMGKSLVQWFAFTIVVGIFVAYLANLTLARGAGFLPVFRLTGTAAVLAYAVSSIPDSIWKGQSWKVTGKFVLDGFAYGMVTGVAFGWLWPSTM